MSSDLISMHPLIIVQYETYSFAAYARLAGSSFAARSHARTALFLVGAAALLLLLIGIHNACDTVTHLVFVEKPARQEDERNRSS